MATTATLTGPTSAPARTPQDPDRFKFTGAWINMWADGDGITGYKFRYRPVPQGGTLLPAGENWSPWAERSSAGVLVAGPQGQSYSISSDWALQIELEFVRPGFNYVYRYAYRIDNPRCDNYMVAIG